MVYIKQVDFIADWDDVYVYVQMHVCQPVPDSIGKDANLYRTLG